MGRKKAMNNRAHLFICSVVCQLMMFVVFISTMSFAASTLPSGKMSIRGARITFSHPPIQVPLYNSYCVRSDEHGEECLEGGWRTEKVDRGAFGWTVDAHVYANGQEAKAAFDAWSDQFEHGLQTEMEKWAANFTKEHPDNEYQSWQISQKLVDWSAEGFDGGFIREWNRTIVEDRHEPKTNCSSMCRFRRTTTSSGLAMVLRKGNVVFEAVDGNAIYFTSQQGRTSRYDHFPDDWDDHDRQQAVTEEAAGKAGDRYWREQVKADIARLPAAAPDLQRLVETFLQRWKRANGKGRDVTDMTLDELLGMLIKPMRPDLVKHRQQDLEIRQNAYAQKPEALNPDFAAIIAEWRNASMHFFFSHWWRRDVKKLVADMKASAPHFSLHWHTCADVLTSHYLYQLQKKVEAAGALSDSQRLRLRTGIIGGFGSYWYYKPLYPLYYVFGSESVFKRVTIFHLLSLVPPATGQVAFGQMRLSAALSRLPADGHSATAITIRVTRLPAADGADPEPVKGAVVTLENVAVNGKAPGRLSADQVVTGADGTAQVTYTAPNAEAVAGEAVPRAEIRVRYARLDIEDSVFVDLDVQAPMAVRAAHLIMPADPSVANEVTFRFDTPQKDWGDEFKAVISCASDHGRIATLRSGDAGGRNITVQATAGTDNTLVYRWDGPQAMEKAFDEVIEIKIPKLKLVGRVKVSVGIDLAVASATVGWKPPFLPFLTIPIKVFVADRLHPEADLAAMFDEFDIRPAVTVAVNRFVPQALMKPDTDEDLLVAAAGRFIERHTGSAAAGRFLTRDLVLATVKKTRDGRWLVMDKDLSGEGLTIDQAFPAIIPYQRGTYVVSIQFDPKFKGDAAAGQPVALDPIDVSRTSVHQVGLEMFLLPTLKSTAALTEAGGLAFGLTDLAVKVRKGDTAGAIGDAAAMMGGKYFGDKLGGALKARYRKALNRFYKQKVAAAFNTTVDKLLPRQSELALRLAYPYKLAHWVEKVSGWAVGQVIDDIRPSGRYDGKDGRFVAQLAQLLDRAVATAEAADRPPVDRLQLGLDYLKRFTKGYGDTLGVLIVTRDGLTDIKAFDADGRALTPAPDNVFAGSDPAEMLVLGDRVAVIPFERGRDVHIRLAGQGKPVHLFKIIGGTASRGTLDYHGRQWQKTLTVKARR